MNRLRWFLTGWGRLFLVAWVAWIVFHANQVNEGGSWLFHHRSGGEVSEMILVGLLVPFFGFRLAAWVLAGIKPDYALAPLPWRRMAIGTAGLALVVAAIVYVDHVRQSKYDPDAAAFDFGPTTAHQQP